jgi:heterodisulfide reductase subunit C
MRVPVASCTRASLNGFFNRPAIDKVRELGQYLESSSVLRLWSCSLCAVQVGRYHANTPPVVFTP